VLIQPVTCEDREGGREGVRELGREEKLAYQRVENHQAGLFSLPPSLPPYLANIGDGSRQGHKQNVRRREDDTLFPHCASLRIVHVVELVENHGKNLFLGGGRDGGREGDVSVKPALGIVHI